MELMQNAAKMQTTQMRTTHTQNSTSSMQDHQVQATQKAEQRAEQSPIQKVEKVETEKEMDQLIQKLNEAISPFRTSLKFGFDNSSEDFYVSVIESKTNRILSRFPAEEAVSFLPKIQEVNGFLFDQKG
ncbi:MAG: flagellar biosynthesis protein FlaG [Sulfurimonas sp.]|nr:MAG: flagellar biosynthesis protein FlaG [Sulfurimonas sp.]